MFQIRQSAQLLDDALLSRDTALSNAEKSQNDLSKVSSAMETLVQEVADRVKSEVDKAKSQYNQNICRLIDEVEVCRNRFLKCCIASVSEHFCSGMLLLYARLRAYRGKYLFQVLGGMCERVEKRDKCPINRCIIYSHLGSVI